jgi:hypothetical protein
MCHAQWQWQTRHRQRTVQWLPLRLMKQPQKRSWPKVCKFFCTGDLRLYYLRCDFTLVRIDIAAIGMATRPRLVHGLYTMV